MNKQKTIASCYLNVAPFTQVNSLEHIAKKILTLNLPLIGRISQFFFKTLSRIYKTSRKHLKIHKFSFNNVHSLSIMYKIYQKILKKLCWLGKGQVLHHEGNKVEVLEGKFRSLKLFFVPRKKTAFTCHMANQNCHTSCVRVLYMFWMN